MRVANKAIQKEIHPIPTVEEIVQEMSATCHFLRLDLHSGYHQLEIDAASRERTTFATHLRLCGRKRLTLGTASA